MTTTTDRIIAAADAVVHAHADALAPLTAIGRSTVTAPPAVEAGLAAVAQLTTTKLALDAAMTDLLRALIGAGVTPQKVARMLNLRIDTLTVRLTSDPVPTVAVAIPAGAIRYRDAISTRAARETLIAAARDLAAAYAGALRPLSAVSQGTLPEAAVCDAALAAVVHLHRAQGALAGALDQVLAALVLGGVMRKALAATVGVSIPTLRRRLADQPLSSARHVDLVDQGDGRWAVTPAAVGRYAPEPEVDPDLLAEVLDGVVAGYAGNGGHARAREDGNTVTASVAGVHDGRSVEVNDGVSTEGGL